MDYDFNYFITLSSNTENVWNISTNESLVNLDLQINQSYSIDIIYEVNGLRTFLANYQIYWFWNNDCLVQINIAVSKNETFTASCTFSENKAFNNCIILTNLSSVGKVSNYNIEK